MRRLLIIGILTAIALGLIAVPASTTHADSSYSVFVYLYHPTGDSSQSAFLSCGWHADCDNNPSEPESQKIGLDWKWQPYPVQCCNHIALRLKLLGGSIAQVADGYSRAWPDAVGCTAVLTEIWGTDPIRYIGRIGNNHTIRSGIAYHPLYSSSPSTSYEYTPLATYSTGSCGRGHTAQAYFSGAGDLGYSKNTNIPNEQSGSQPGLTYGIWSQTEYIFFFCTASASCPP